MEGHFLYRIMLTSVDHTHANDSIGTYIYQHLTAYINESQSRVSDLHTP